MYTVYDFINNDIESKYMKFGWKVETSSFGTIVLKYCMLNFDWNSLDFINDELWNMFLSSKSFMKFKAKSDRAMSKFKRLYFDAMSISHLKMMIAEYDLKIDVDKLIQKTVKKKAEKLKQNKCSYC